MHLHYNTDVIRNQMFGFQLAVEAIGAIHNLSWFRVIWQAICKVTARASPLY